MFSLLLSLILLYGFSRLELRIRCISREKLPTKMFASAGNINSKNNYEPVLIISTAGVFFRLHRRTCFLLQVYIVASC